MRPDRGPAFADVYPPMPLSRRREEDTMVEFWQPAPVARRPRIVALRVETGAWGDVRAALCATKAAELGEEADGQYHRRPHARTDRYACEMRDVP